MTEETIFLRRIWCPYHHTFEQFTPGHVPQPHDPMTVRYPCGYMHGLATSSGASINAADQSLDRLVQQVNELREEVSLLKEQVAQLTQKSLARITRPSVPAERSVSSQAKGGVAM